MRKLTLLTFTVGMALGHGAGISGLVYAADPAGTSTATLVRVRSESPEIAEVIRGASEQSETFRRLIAAIDDTDGLVYVEDGKCGHSVRACLMLSVKVAGPFRLLRVKIDARRRDCRLMGDIGHELQHAIEVLSDPYVTDAARAYMYFDRIGPTDRGRFETRAAVHMGDQVADEACHGRR